MSKPFRDYYKTIASAREQLVEYLRSSGDHHFFVSGAETPEPEAQVAAVADEVEDLAEVGDDAP